MHAVVEEIAEQIDHALAHPRAPGGEIVGSEEQDRANDVIGKRITDADRMAADQVLLKVAQPILWDPDRREITETRVHPVDRGVTLRQLRDDLGSVVHAMLGTAIERDRDAAPRDRDDVADGEVVSGQAQCGHRISVRFSRYQAESST